MWKFQIGWNKMVDLKNLLYLESLDEYLSLDIDWNFFSNKNIMISWGTGMIWKYFIDFLMRKNLISWLNCHIIVLCRDIIKWHNMFDIYKNSKLLTLIEQNIINSVSYNGEIDYIIHAASNTSPKQYIEDSIGTIYTNFIWTKNLLELGLKRNIKKFILLSSFEVYWAVNFNQIFENSWWIIDCSRLRSCYPESKRLSELLCNAYTKTHNIETVILRLSRVFGPTLNWNSTLSISEFIKAWVEKKDIVLKSNGLQNYSYNYVGDIVSALLYLILYWESWNAYNISSPKFDATLKDFAEIIVNYTWKKLVFDIPSEIEKQGYSSLERTILNSNKLRALWWNADSNLSERIIKTIKILEKNKV